MNELLKTFPSSTKVHQNPWQNQKYPWRVVEVGFSFFVRLEAGITQQAKDKMVSNLRSQASARGKQLGRKFRVVIHEDGIEIARLADPVQVKEEKKKGWVGVDKAV